MPAERDRILGELAVEQGLIAREDAERYYAFLDAARQAGTPGAPPLAQLLVRDGRATAQDLQRLRELWQSRQAPGPPATASWRSGRSSETRPPLAPLPPANAPNGRPATGSWTAPVPPTAAEEAQILAEPTVIVRGGRGGTTAPGSSPPRPTQQRAAP